MAWRPHGKARVNARSPSAFAICDRCGFLHNHCDLSWEFDWRGPQLTNLRILVCRKCKDRPQEQNRPKITPPDPVPIQNPRIEQYSSDNVGITRIQASIPPTYIEDE